jgi:hypothetical protein
MLLKPFQDADVSETERASSFESDADARARFECRLRGWRCLRGRLRRRRILLRKTNSAEE